MKNLLAMIDRVARSLYAVPAGDDDYEYEYDPRHEKKPSGGGWEQTDKGWKKDKEHVEQGKPAAPAAQLNNKQNAYAQLHAEQYPKSPLIKDALEQFGVRSKDLFAQDKDNKRAGDIIKKSIQNGSVNKYKLIAYVSRMAQAITDPAKALRRGMAFDARRKQGQPDAVNQLMEKASDVFYKRARELSLEKHKQHAPPVAPAAPVAPAPAPKVPSAPPAPVKPVEPPKPATPAPAPAPVPEPPKPATPVAPAPAPVAPPSAPKPAPAPKPETPVAPPKPVEAPKPATPAPAKPAAPAPKPVHRIPKRHPAKRSLHPVRGILGEHKLAEDSDEIQELTGFKHSIMHHPRMSQKQINQMKDKGGKFWPRNAAKLRSDFIKNMDPSNYSSPEAFRNAQDRFKQMPVMDFEKILAAIMSDEDEEV